MSTSSSPQLGLRTQIIYNQADIQSLFSSPKIILPVQSGYINVFVSASTQYVFKNTVFTNVDNVLEFYQEPTVGSPVLVSNSLNALNFLGLPQNSSLNFIAANPYSASMADMVDAPVILQMAGGDPIGGDPTSLMIVIVTYNLMLA